MKREKLRRFLFVSAACLLSFPWLTPCAGIWSALVVDGAHSAITHRDSYKPKLSGKQLKEWAAKPGPPLKVSQNQFIPTSLLIKAEELSTAKGGRTAPRPGTLVGRGASAIVDGVTETLIWIDPYTWISRNGMDMEATKPKRQLVLSESPFVVLQGDDIRYIRDGKNGPVRLARATNAEVTIITPEGSWSGSARFIHFRGPSQEVILDNPYGVHSGSQQLHPLSEKPGRLMKLNFVKRTVACNGVVQDGYFLRRFH